MFFHSAAYKECKKQLQSIGNNEREDTDRQDLQKAVISASRTVHCFEPQGADQIAENQSARKDRDLQLLIFRDERFKQDI